MTIERYIKRTIWTAKCPECGDSKETTSPGKKERRCNECKIWVPYEAQSYVGPDVFGDSQ